MKVLNVINELSSRRTLSAYVLTELTFSSADGATVIQLWRWRTQTHTGYSYSFSSSRETQNTPTPICVHKFSTGVLVSVCGLILSESLRVLVVLAQTLYLTLSVRIIWFLLLFPCLSTEQLVVKILKALDLPAKDANGFSDPYVKIYLLPDRKKKFQTKVRPTSFNLTSILGGDWLLFQWKANVLQMITALLSFCIFFWGWKRLESVVITTWGKTRFDPHI